MLQAEGSQGVLIRFYLIIHITLHQVVCKKRQRKYWVTRIYVYKATSRWRGPLWVWDIREVWALAFSGASLSVCDGFVGVAALPCPWLLPHSKQMALTIMSDRGIHLAFWPRPPLFCNIDLFVFSPQQMRHPALVTLGIWDMVMGVIASLAWQEEKAVFSNYTHTNTHRVPVSHLRWKEHQSTVLCIINGHNTQD